MLSKHEEFVVKQYLTSYSTDLTFDEIVLTVSPSVKKQMECMLHELEEHYQDWGYIGFTAEDVSATAFNILHDSETATALNINDQVEEMCRLYSSVYDNNIIRMLEKIDEVRQLGHYRSMLDLLSNLVAYCNANTVC